jgi:lipopolysaccharide biosynthesis glycosyltransferase
MRSIIENADTRQKYEFIILHCGDISQNSMKKLCEMLTEFRNFSIEFSDFTEIAKNYNFFISRHITVEAYFRLFIPFKFPQYEKALYFDGDMVCRTDISRLFNMDILNYLIGAVHDIAVAWYFLPENLKNDEFRKIYEYILSTEKPSDYINSGMLLMNCKKFRQIYSEKDVVDTILSREWQVHDQDVINFLAKDKILYLDYEWNFMSNGWAKYLPQNLKNKYIYAEENPKIIHNKPYKYWWYIPYFDEFWKYATRTPFIKEIAARMDINMKFEDKICTAIQEKKTVLGGRAMLKIIFTFLIHRFRK